MKILEYFHSWQDLQLLLTPLLAGLLVAILCAALSVLVVLKRLAFVGQGVSHSAFGGIGIAAVASVLAASSGTAVSIGQGSVAEFLIVVAFCIASALGMAAVGARRSGQSGQSVQVDTGIGLFLVAAMAMGGLLVQYANTLARSRGVTEAQRSWESILFGSVTTASWADVYVSLAVLVLTVLVLWYFRRVLLFWTFDETSAPAFGVPVTLARTVLMTLLAIATVTAMKICGVVLATAMLVLPGAIALKLSRRFEVVFALSIISACTGVVGGLWLSIETDAQTGPCIVLLLCVLFALAVLRTRLTSPAAASPALPAKANP
jgi:ABC-type Mn2+/Zn2+ transport system permease subunit